MSASTLPLDLYLVTDEAACLGRDLFWIVEEAVKGGVSLVQLREKNLDTRDFIDKASKMKELLAPYNVPLIINDRVDVALAAGADGVHVGQSDMHYHQLRQVLPGQSIVGISAENMANVEEANDWEISYLAISPLFDTPTKPDTGTAWGMAGLQQAAKVSRHPLVVIGGINTENVTQAIQHGASGIAVVSAICSAAFPGYAAEQLRKAVISGKKNRL
ncbi:thiamine phosphate synthase [Dyadobacter sandarakinus]|uniref:Thiamine-phosphate synthase n=1 Tax=Dyadobacter sandarakinus TaxID=2747268 RepID=A0ABX7I711_9BACT|nr:thiamine phosphate synthase [Dyadobacter sandarakinus]QRR01892.1 thiamine phosphate synthase [Dyadobacter sandarakinus]